MGKKPAAPKTKLSLKLPVKNTQVDDGEFEDINTTQKRVEEEAKQLKEDEELARKLQAELNNNTSSLPSNNYPSHTNGTTSKFTNGSSNGVSDKNDDKASKATVHK